MNTGQMLEPLNTIRANDVSYFGNVEITDSHKCCNEEADVIQSEE